jgi:hypothetical protein
MDRYDKIAAYSRILDQIDSLRDVEANEEIDGFAFTKLDEAHQSLEDARDRVEKPY